MRNFCGAELVAMNKWWVAPIAMADNRRSNHFEPTFFCTSVSEPRSRRWPQIRVSNVIVDFAVSLLGDTVMTEPATKGFSQSGRKVILNAAKRLLQKIFKPCATI